MGEVIEAICYWASDHPLKAFISAGAGVSLLVVAGCNIGNNIEYSNGGRVGVINKFTKKGLIWKTYEGEMALEGIVSSGGAMGANIWQFSLDNQARHGENIGELANKIDDYLKGGAKVRIDYVEPWTAWPWRSGTDYLVQKIEPMQDKR